MARVFVKEFVEAVASYHAFDFAMSSGSVSAVFFALPDLLSFLQDAAMMSTTRSIDRIFFIRFLFPQKSLLSFNFRLKSDYFMQQIRTFG